MDRLYFDLIGRIQGKAYHPMLTLCQLQQLAHSTGRILDKEIDK